MQDDNIGYVETYGEVQAELNSAGSRLVVLEVMSPQVCQTGLDEEPELQWESEKRAALQRCSGLMPSLQRIAAECPDVRFLAAEVCDHKDPLCRELGVTVLPSLLFFRGGRKLFEHKGVLQLEEELGQGVLYWGDTAANNQKASEYVTSLETAADVDEFLAAQPAGHLAVLKVSTTICEPCVAVYPAVLALARSFAGYAAFARLVGDEDDAYGALLGQLGVEEVPTFIFFRDGHEVGRHVGSSKGDLIGKILQVQANAGIAAPSSKRRVVRRVGRSANRRR